MSRPRRSKDHSPSSRSKADACRRPHLVNTKDNTNAGSLRSAIDQANADPDPASDQIDFNIPTTDPGYRMRPCRSWAIEPSQEFPTFPRGRDQWIFADRLPS